MDERFLCRGKRLDNGEWVQGYIWINETLVSTTTYHIADRDGDSHDIDPNTRCQCTGLRDKNGVLVFEGDIISYKVCSSCPALRAVVERSNNMPGLIAREIEDKGIYDIMDTETSIEVIGNRWDSPELMGGAEC